MEIFVVVVAVEGGNFTEAVRRLDLSAVMVGKYVRELEVRPGARLLERSTRRQSRVFHQDASALGRKNLKAMGRCVGGGFLGCCAA